MNNLFKNLENIIKQDVPQNLTSEQKERIEKIQRRIENAQSKSRI